MMKEAKRHYVPSKERINMFYGELQMAMQAYNCTKIERSGNRLTIKTELKTRYPEEEKLEIETNYRLDLTRLLVCSDNELDAEIEKTVLAIMNSVRKQMIREGIYKLCGFVSWI